MKSPAFLTLALAFTLQCPAAWSAAPDGANAPASLPDSEPGIRSVVDAKFPDSVAAKVKKGSAITRIIVDDHGAITSARVLKASEPEFGQAALAAVKRWQFSPGVDRGKYVAMCVDVPFDFDATTHAGRLPVRPLLQMVPYTPAKLVSAPVGECPETFAGRGLPGDVMFACTVQPDGSITKLQIITASNADYVLPALAAAKDWQFKPAQQGDLTVASELKGEVFYTDTRAPDRDKVLAANGVTAPDGSAPALAPRLVAVTDPVWPTDLLLSGQGGTATVQFTVAANGVVRDVTIKEATQPAFGAAVAAAIATWVFEPAMEHGKSVDVTLVKHAEFKAGSAADGQPDWMTRLVARAKSNSLPGGRGLDGRITPIYRVVPVLADTASDVKGGATIEFVIDRDGRARLPRIVSASDDAHGWAAVTAVSQWIFAPPTRSGQPSEAKVQIPMSF